MATFPVRLSPAPSTACSPVQPAFEPDRAAQLAWRALRRLGVPEHAVADAVQDCLLVVHRRLADFRGDANFESWLYGIVLRVASGYRRRERRALAVFDPRATSAPETISTNEPSPFERMQQKAAAELLLRLLDELPAPLREVFVLVELEELPLHQAVELLGWSLTTGKSRLRTARRSFEALVARTRARLGETEARS